MKRLLTAALITSTLLLSAQVLRADNDAPKQHQYTPEKMVERMATRLDLTEDQKNNIITIKKDEYEKIRALRDESRAKIESTLTAEQKQKQLELQKEYKDSKHAKRSKYRNCDDKK